MYHVQIPIAVMLVMPAQPSASYRNARLGLLHGRAWFRTGSDKTGNVNGRVWFDARKTGTISVYLSKGQADRFEWYNPDCPNPHCCVQSVCLIESGRCCRTSSTCVAVAAGGVVQVDDVQVELALQWTSDAFSDSMVGFVNSIKTIDGGTHMEASPPHPL